MSWTFDLFREYSSKMTIASIMRYREFLKRDSRGQLRNQAHTFRLSVKAPVRASFTVRESYTDLATVKEIFFEQVYGDLVPHVRNPRTIIDLGANIGLATVYFATVFPEAAIFALEPEPSNFAILAQNVRRLSPRCRALQAAIWSHPCPLRVHNADERFHNIFQMQPCEDMPGAIQGLDMPSILEKSGFDSVDLLKVDVEGAEVQLFQGDLSWMPRVRAFAVEFHGDSREVSRFDMLMQGRRVIQANPHTVIALA